MVKLDYKCSCGGIVKYCCYVRGEYRYIDGKRIHIKGFQEFKCSSCGFVEYREI